jgi:hypothetical protein
MDQIIYVLLMTVFVVNVQGYNLTDFQTLHTDLFTSHKKSVMPMESQWKPLTVGIKFYLNSITSFKEVDDTMSLLVSSLLIWNDPSLSWILLPKPSILSTLFTTNIGGIQIFSEGTEVFSIPAYDPGFQDNDGSFHINRLLWCTLI